MAAKLSGPRASFVYPWATKPKPTTSLSGTSAHRSAAGERPTPIIRSRIVRMLPFQSATPALAVPARALRRSRPPGYRPVHAREPCGAVSPEASPAAHGRGTLQDVDHRLSELPSTAAERRGRM